MYVKLFSKILDSSIWLEPQSTRIVWITLLAAMDQDGYAHFAAIENLARRANVEIEEARKAIDCLMSPDVNSANTNNDGKRVEKVPGGYLVCNAKEHRKIIDRKIAREQTRKRVAKHRAKQGLKQSLEKNVTKSVTEALQSVTTASASASALSLKGGAGGKAHCTLQEAIDFCLSIGLSKSDGEYCFHHWEGNGWMTGKQRIKDWKATIRAWSYSKYLPSQRQSQSTESPQERAERLLRKRKNAR